MDLDVTVEKIKSLEIQGATDVAISGVRALKNFYEKGVSSEEFRKAVEKVKSSRPTEPALFNAVEYVEGSKDFETALNHLENSIPNVSKVFSDNFSFGKVHTHCHSDTVVQSILKMAENGNVEVYNTETRPVFQGRVTAKELAEEGLDVTHMVDSAASFALESVDCVLLGADAVTSNGDVYNKIGSSLIAEKAKKLGVPVYVLTDSWKFSNSESVEIEERDVEEVWEDAPENVEVINPAFDRIPKELVTGIVSEIGVSKPEEFSEDVKEAYPSIFN